MGWGRFGLVLLLALAAWLHGPGAAAQDESPPRVPQPIPLPESKPAPSPFEALPDWTEEAEACYQAVEQPSDGVVLCTKAIEAGGLSLDNLAITYSNRGNSFFDLRRFHRAIDDYNIALGLVPDDPVTLSNRGAAYTDLGQYALALEDLGRAIELDGQSPTAWANRCWVHALVEDFDAAIKDCTKAIHLAPTDPVPLSSRAFAYLSKNKLKAALADADKAVRYGPHLWEAYFYRGLIHDARRDKSRALEDLAKAFELGPDEPRIAQTMAKLGFKVPTKDAEDEVEDAGKPAADDADSAPPATTPGE